MAPKKSTSMINQDQLKELLQKEGDVLKPLIQDLMNEILSAEMDDCVQANSYERRGKRLGYR